MYAQIPPSISPEVQQIAGDLEAIGISADNFASTMAPIGIGILCFVILRYIVKRIIYGS
jgi:hypothetical protein